ncbi:MAG: hypothetical protein ACOVMP_06435 [Chthoniobacterales bacterium]
MKRSNLPETKNDAWIGDAVLALYVRSWILRESKTTDGERQRAMTSNQFLANFGNPTEVEAEIGRIYRTDGLDAAFQWIESHLIPTFQAQEKRKLRQRA